MTIIEIKNFLANPENHIHSGYDIQKMYSRAIIIVVGHLWCTVIILVWWENSRCYTADNGNAMFP